MNTNEHVLGYLLSMVRSWRDPMPEPKLLTLKEPQLFSCFASELQNSLTVFSLATGGYAPGFRGEAMVLEQNPALHAHILTLCCQISCLLSHYWNYLWSLMYVLEAPADIPTGRLMKSKAIFLSLNELLLHSASSGFKWLPLAVLSMSIVENEISPQGSRWVLIANRVYPRVTWDKKINWKTASTRLTYVCVSERLSWLMIDGGGPLWVSRGPGLCNKANWAWAREQTKKGVSEQILPWLLLSV